MSRLRLEEWRREPPPASIRFMTNLGVRMPVPENQDFEAFVRDAQARLVRVADLLTGDRGRAEDHVQHALIKLFLSWGRLRSQSPEAYCRKIIVHAQIDWWRRRFWT